jgi:CheY-like chemotaxis protein
MFPGDSPMSTKAVNVLIADDDPLIAATLRQILSDRGHNAYVAKDGRAALQVLTRHKIEFVLMDIFMPDQDGIETLKEIKQTFPETMVGIMSGGGIRGRFDFLDMALRLGADGIAQKPISRAQLLDMVENCNFPAQRTAY